MSRNKEKKGDCQTPSYKGYQRKVIERLEKHKRRDADNLKQNKQRARDNS